MQDIVVAKLPNAGLGNKLFVWGAAFIFAKQNNLPLYIIGLNRIHLGPFLRNEKVKRLYYGQFKRQKTEIKLLYWKHKFRGTSIIYEPKIGQMKSNYPTQFIFNTIPSWRDYFGNLNQDRIALINEFNVLLSKKVTDRLSIHTTLPAIAIHIRMGDFKTLQDGKDFKLESATRTPLHYFKQCLLKIREKFSYQIKATIFTDGYKEEVQELLAIENVEFHEADLDVVDLLLLSKSKVIVTSAHSSFSEWAGFLSEAAIIRHPDHIHSRIRIEEDLFEGTIDEYMKLPITELYK